MNVEQLFKHETLPSGKTIRRRFNDDGSLHEETHSYGVLDIAITHSFEKGAKTSEMYFAKRRMVSRRTYEKARAAYSDMPPADEAIEDFGSLLLSGARQEQRQSKIERERRLAESAESRFIKPASTNWLRVISGEKSHLVIFASRDWKLLTRESLFSTGKIQMGRHWLRSFGFSGVPGSRSMALEVGYEVEGDRLTMLNNSKALLKEVIEFQKVEPTQWQGSIRPRRKPRKQVYSWLIVLPPLIEFLEGLQGTKVKIFNHHR